MKEVIEKKVLIPVGHVTLAADLQMPKNAKSLVIFSHGSGSSRFSPRNRYVARMLNEEGIATLLADLLTANEDVDYMQRFDIELLTTRLTSVTKWALQQPELKKLAIGYFGASTGAASALKAAAILKNHIQAVVSRGGRADLAKTGLPKVEAPVLLITGSLDEPVVELNDEAYEQMKCHRELKIVWGATHLFEEPGKLEEVARLAADWFDRYLVQKEEPVI